MTPTPETADSLAVELNDLLAIAWVPDAIEAPTNRPLREALARHIGKSGWVRPVGDPPDHDRAWRHMIREAEAMLDDPAIAAALAQPAPAGYHGDGVNDSHYDPGCGRCIEQRDQTRPDVPWDTIYAEVES